MLIHQVLTSKIYMKPLDGALLERTSSYIKHYTNIVIFFIYSEVSASSASEIISGIFKIERWGLGGEAPR